MSNIVIFQDGLIQFFGRHTIEMRIVILLLLITIATYSDIQSRRIPNWLTLCGTIIAIAYQTAPSFYLGITYSIGGFFIGLLCFLPLYMLRAMGAGDVKLMAMVGAFLGPSSIFSAILLTLIAGGILSLVAAVWNRTLFRVFDNLRLIFLHSMVSAINRSDVRLDRASMSTGRLPYAVAIATGTITHLFFFEAATF